jgi:hypothetical protein
MGNQCGCSANPEEGEVNFKVISHMISIFVKGNKKVEGSENIV